MRLPLTYNTMRYAQAAHDGSYQVRSDHLIGNPIGSLPLTPDRPATVGISGAGQRIGEKSQSKI